MQSKEFSGFQVLGTQERRRGRKGKGCDKKYQNSYYHHVRSSRSETDYQHSTKRISYM
jgi:hypothetical protein